MIVGAINQQELHWGVEQCQVIIVVYGLSGLVERRGIKCFGKVVTQAIFRVQKVGNDEQ